MTGASFVYDPLGRRMSKTVSGTTTEFLYDGVNPVQELSGGTPTANLLTGLGIDEYFIRTDTMGTETLLTDALGSTMALADSTGTVLTEYTYEPFGRTVFAGAPSDNAFQYTGRENDNTGLYYYRARYYSPTLQRFISEDPLGVAVNPFLRIGANHLYAFAENNPIRFTDPTGLAVWVCNRKTDWGVGNHAYLWDDRRAGRSCGMRGSSNRGGTSGTNDGGPSVDSCRRISGSNGMEDELMRCCEETANRGAWFPPINDCHEAVDDCIRGSNLKNPGAPGGRIGKPCELCDNK
jgi:RHS repeat-associated protein